MPLLGERNLFNICVISCRYRWTIPITYITNKIEFPTLVWFDKDAKKRMHFDFVIYNL